MNSVTCMYNNLNFTFNSLNPLGKENPNKIHISSLYMYVYLYSIQIFGKEIVW